MRTFHVVQAAGAGVLILILLVAVQSLPVAATSANISRSYASDNKLAVGSIVILDQNRKDFVQLANMQNSLGLIGVVVASNDSLLAIDPIDGAAQVATSGSVNTLVSTVNGNISVGDQVSPSSFNGIGMKAQPGSRVIGNTQTAFSKQTMGATVETVTDIAGHKQTIYVGYVRLNIAIATATGDPYATTGIQKFAKSFTGHTISNTRIFIAIVVTIIGLLLLISLIYGAIYSSIISIGRNPLAKYAVLRSLGMVLGMVALIAFVTSVIVFFLLR